MQRWGWLAICLVLATGGGLALYAGGFREVAVYAPLLFCPLLHLALGRRHHG